MHEQVTRELTLIAGADIGTVTEPPEEFAEWVLPALQTADLRFAQCERSFSTRGYPPGWGRNGTGEGNGDHTRLSPELAEVWRTAGIDVASLASNHTRDWGPEALVDTLELFEKMGIATIGAGKNDEEARRPAVFDIGGVSVAFLGYVSVIRNGEHAGPGRPGLAPLRARTYYEPIDYQPGCPPRILTVAYEEDVQAMIADIGRARQLADVVVVSLHWGVHLLPKVLGTYQPPVAHAAIDAGADLILGHHTHLINAVEVYRGKVCFYGIGNFMSSGVGKGGMPTSYYNIYWYPDEPNKGVQVPELYPFPPDSKKSMLVKATMNGNGISRVAFLPMWIDNHAKPAVLSSGDPRFDDVVNYVRWTSDQSPTDFRVDGNEVVIETETHT